MHYREVTKIIFRPHKTQLTAALEVSQGSWPLEDSVASFDRVVEVQPCHLWRLRAWSRLCQMDGDYSFAVSGRLRAKVCVTGLSWMIGILKNTKLNSTGRFLWEL